VLGLIFKVLLFFAIIIFGLAALLNFTDTMTWGTMSLSTPDVAACQRFLDARGDTRRPELMQVRWIWSAKEYGWGCAYEWDDFEVETVTPMPE
jgi:hypothetical protein